jgi:hypothetical protein
VKDQERPGNAIHALDGCGLQVGCRVLARIPEPSTDPRSTRIPVPVTEILYAGDVDPAPEELRVPGQRLKGEKPVPR